LNTQQLYLASQSGSRQLILKEALIPFKLINHSYDEESVPFKGNFEEYVMTIATGKNESIATEMIDASFETAFIVTADTLIQSTVTGEILAKPLNKEHAIDMIRTISKGTIIVATAMVVRKLERIDVHAFRETARKNVVVSIPIEFSIPENRIADYFANSPSAMVASGACTVEEFGHQFMKSMNGSFTGAQGIPAFELREALEELGFY
jgi:septum formation protein